jgi:hypothetical protein
LECRAALQVLPLIMEAAIEGPPLSQDSGSQSVSPFINTRPEATAALADYVIGMAAESVILVTDFGYSGALVPDAFDRLMTEYGTTACYAVFFDELIAAAEGTGATCCLSAREAGGTHTLAIYKGKRVEAFKDRFETSFTKAPDRQGSTVSQLGPDASRKAVLRAEKQMRAAMDDRNAFSYADLANLAHLLTRYRRYDSAREFAVICDARFGLISAPEQLLLGDLATREGDREGASRWFERARSSASTYGPAHIKAAQVYKVSGRLAEYASVMTDYVRVTDETAAAHVEWLGQIDGSDVSVIPDEVESEFEEICRAEFG